MLGEVESSGERWKGASEESDTEVVRECRVGRLLYPGDLRCGLQVLIYSI